MSTHRKIMSNANAVGFFEGALTKRLKPGSAVRAGMLVSFDNDEQFVVPCSEKSIPWGIALRDTTASDDKTYISVQPLSNNGQTARILVTDAVKAGEFISFSKDGFGKKCTDGNNIVGLALSSGGKDNRIEALTTLPYNVKCPNNDKIEK